MKSSPYILWMQIRLPNPKQRFGQMEHTVFLKTRSVKSLFFLDLKFLLIYDPKIDQKCPFF